jgi:hypothetical protein
VTTLTKENHMSGKTTTRTGRCAGRGCTQRAKDGGFFCRTCLRRRLDTVQAQQNNRNGRTA